jgi:hypothetical protein
MKTKSQAHQAVENDPTVGCLTGATQDEERDDTRPDSEDYSGLGIKWTSQLIEKDTESSSNSILSKLEMYPVPNCRLI